MEKIFLFFKIFIVLLILNANASSKESIYFVEGLKLFESSKLDESKILFERDLVFNPKSEKSYLYLAKIFNKKEEDEEQEKNLNNVLLLNPKNDEAIYMLTILKIKQSNYEEAKELIKKFTLVCNDFCSKQKEINSKLKKITPENE